MKTILLVEDEKALVEALSEFLKDKKYVVEVAYTGKEALEKVEVIKPDLILLDIVMPDLSGIDFLKTIQAEGSKSKDTPVVILSNLQGDVPSLEKMGLHVADYFVKANISLEALARRISKYLS